MKWLLYLIVVVFTSKISAQSYPVKNVNDEYIATRVGGYNLPRVALQDMVKAKNGPYWFHTRTEVFSFDGINWRNYKFKSAIGDDITIGAIFDIMVADNGEVWLATEDGLFVFDPASIFFIPVEKKYPEIKNWPVLADCVEKDFNNILISTVAKEGFYLFDTKQKKLKHISIDEKQKVYIKSNYIVRDSLNNLWGNTRDYLGIWQYNISTGKTRCSWKGELPGFTDNRFKKNFMLTSCENENALWITFGDFGEPGFLEKINLSTGRSNYYSFSGDLNIHADSSTKHKLVLWFVEIDKENNAWIRVEDKYLVKLNNDISKTEYLVNDPADASTITVKFRPYKPETAIVPEKDRSNNIWMWVFSSGGAAMITKRTNIVTQIPADTLIVDGIKAADYSFDGWNNIFFERTSNNQYILFQNGEGRPKLIFFDSNFHVQKSLFNNEWKQYPVYFSKTFDTENVYFAIMRKGIEPVDMRKVVLKDIKVNLRTFGIEERQLSFRERVWRYGSGDNSNLYWLFSAGYLYSYDKSNDRLDSILICKPAEKGVKKGLIKGYDYLTALHKESSTFWIAFEPARELYKINLKTKKIETIFKTCKNREDCTIPGNIKRIEIFDSLHVLARLGLNNILIDTHTDSLTDFADLFPTVQPFVTPYGAIQYKNWICYLTEKRMSFLNTVSNERKELSFNKDFKWTLLSSVESKPIITDNGKVVLVSREKQGFLIFNIDSIISPVKPGVAKLSYITLDNKSLSPDSLMKKGSITLKYSGYNTLNIGFSDYTISGQDNIRYEYTLYKGGDTVWNKIEGKPELTLSELSSGNYQLLLRAENGPGNYSAEITSFGIEITPSFWQTGWFRVLVIAIIGVIFYGLYRYRLFQIKKLQTIRNNIASDLHDDIGSTLNSISIYSEVAKQQAGKEIPALELIGVNSRKIIESMSDIVWTINPENDSFEKIIVRMRSFAYQLLKARKVEYTFEVDEKLNSIALPMQVRKNFYLVFKEAITNLIKYSKATRVSISLMEKNKTILLHIRDNGIGIPLNAEIHGNGLMNMKRRAEEINASLNIISENGDGTGIELILKT